MSLKEELQRLDVQDIYRAAAYWNERPEEEVGRSIIKMSKRYPVIREFWQTLIAAQDSEVGRLKGLAYLEVLHWLVTAAESPVRFDIFISYGSADEELANELRVDFESKGLLCFVAKAGIQAGQQWEKQIQAALLGSDKVLILVTRSSLARQWVQMEVGAAWILNKPVIPALAHVRFDELPEPLRKFQARSIETRAQRDLLIRELAEA